VEVNEAMAWRYWAIKGWQGFLNRLDRFTSTSPLTDWERKELEVAVRRLQEILTRGQKGD
jgi:hypothetical protein